MLRLIENSLKKYKQDGLHRTRAVLQSINGKYRFYEGKKIISFCSNDYLGLAQHPDVIKAFKQTVNKYGITGGSSHFLGAYSYIHHELEEALAEFTNYPRALVFSTGYMTNLSILTALAGRHDVIIGDKLNHASLVDAAKLSGAFFKRYQHKNTISLVNQLTKFSGKKLFIVSDGVFSMDGDLAALSELVKIAKSYSALLLVDDSHGIGVLGEKGGGVCEHFNLKPDILSAGFGKALGAFGGFAVGDTVLIEHLIQFSRPYMYTTALPPAIAKATLTSLFLLQKEKWRRRRLACLIKYFEQGANQLKLPILSSQTSIQPILLGESMRAMKLARYLFDNGFLVSGIRSPTVPKGTARLRVSLNIFHSKNDIDCLLEKIALGLSCL